MTEDLSNHRVTPLMRSLLAAVTVTVLLLALFYRNSTNRADDLDRQAAALSESLEARGAVIDELAADQQALREQLLEADIEPVVPAPTETVREIIRETGAIGAQGVAGRDGITPACWFEQSQCVGPKGDKGDPPTMADLDAAILRYCATNQCKGDQGEPGADSTVPGPKGDQGEPGPACPAGYEPRVMDSGPFKGWIACAPTGAT